MLFLFQGGSIIDKVIVIKEKHGPYDDLEKKSVFCP
jgi:hypothetical protein